MLASDPDYREPLQALLDGPEPDRFAADPITVALVTAGILFALQSQVEFERDKDGKWSFKFKKKPTDDSLLRPIIEKLLALIP